MANFIPRQKKEFLKALFAGLGILIVIDLAGRMEIMNQTSNTPRYKAITAGLTGKIQLPLEPENITTIPLYQIHSNLWGTLLSTREGEGLAEVLEISADKKTYILKLKDDMKFSNGRTITSVDVIFSLDRILKLQHEGHFNARSVIAEYIAISDQKIKIMLHKATPAFQLLLAIPELGIIPNEIVDENGKIKNTSITSGPYFVEKLNGPESLVLKKNKYFKFHNDDSPDEVTIILLSDTQSTLSRVSEKSLDFVEIYATSTLLRLKEVEETKAYSIHSTRPSLAFFAMPNTKTLSLENRMVIASILSHRFTYQLIEGVERKNLELLPPQTFGSLNLKNSPFLATNLKTSKLPTLKMIKSTSSIVQSIGTTLENAGATIEWLESTSTEEPDLILKSQGMNINFPEIELFLLLNSSSSPLSHSKEEAEMLSKAMHESDEKARHQLIQTLGHSFMADARVIPLIERSYVHAYLDETLSIPKNADYDGDVRFYQMEVK